MTHLLHGNGDLEVRYILKASYFAKKNYVDSALCSCMAGLEESHFSSFCVVVKKMLKCED